LSGKTVALKYFTVLNILFTFRIFDEISLVLKNEFALEYAFFIIQDF